MLASILALIVTVSGSLLALGGVTGSVSGRVINSDGLTVAHAEITLSAPEGTYHTSSGNDGRFRLFGVPVDTYVLHVDKQGYYELERGNIVVGGDEVTALGDVKIAPSGASASPSPDPSPSPK